MPEGREMKLTINNKSISEVGVQNSEIKKLCKIFQR